MEIGKRNILAVYYTASPIQMRKGKNWYVDAHAIADDLGDIYGIATERVCGVIAALSPGCSWEKNIYEAEKCLNYFKMGCTATDAPFIGSYGRANMIKSWRILAGEPSLEALKGNKVRAFFSLLHDPTNSHDVCIDRHALSVWAGEKLGERQLLNFMRSPEKYDAIAQDYRDVAAQLDLLPNQLQAITWVTWRENNVLTFLNKRYTLKS
ncbi:hypothetical protein VF04_04100 [Nostoc linckia z7]|uniref:Uncharacterized protein n=3 Tax=Nostoc linckia TaxID=92942 RepID=A0A9Q5ZGE5_NOSLI|nr:hypothetical protein [Nostoc linckia]PHJ64972.1 hypothetical protein VF02_11585 [Nostoc linckia z1]PHJ89036.1 hypothetical protein VF07_13600 [Nostoc linckia z6]PHK42895.1 hypothetical protein VF12_00800 [Nostoc linckia z15]PHK48052.1 hypothetical protein VF13_01775 [Nostoc linckia z16]PHJ70150.1 hypothetical protein VF05_11745 [Nostoc linckia z3]